MTTITILPEAADGYRALARDKESTGRTAGEALDALTAQLSDDEGGTLVIVQNYKADEFFNAAQQERLAELMQLRQSRPLSSEEGQELESLIEVELNGARLRTEKKVRRPQGGDFFFERKLLNLWHEGFSPAELAAECNADLRKVYITLKKIQRRIVESLPQMSKVSKTSKGAKRKTG
jgi:hypothetical protein